MAVKKKEPKVAGGESKASPSKGVPQAKKLNGTTGKFANPSPKPSDKSTSRHAKAQTNSSENSAKGNANKTASSANKNKEKQETPLASDLKRTVQFLQEVNVERQKISWPERRQIVRETWSVLFLVAIITGLVLGFDWAIGNFVFGPLEHFARLHGGGVGRG